MSSVQLRWSFALPASSPLSALPPTKGPFSIAFNKCLPLAPCCVPAPASYYRSFLFPEAKVRDRPARNGGRKETGIDALFIAIL
ncbi:hypothetical protein ACLOJK_038306 [Asimina triloba]